MAFHSLHTGFLRQNLDHLKLVFILGNGYIGLQSLVRVHALGFAHLTEFLFADGLDDLHPVDIQSQVAFYSPLGLRFRRRHDPGYHIGFCRHGMDIRGGASDINNTEITDAVVEQFRALHDRAGCGNDGSIDHITHVLHARCSRDVVFESILNDLPAGFYIQLVDFGIDVLYVVEFLSTLLIEDKFHLLLVLNVASVDHWCLQTQRADLLRVVDCGIPLAIVDAAGNQDQVWLDFLVIS